MLRTKSGFSVGAVLVGVSLSLCAPSSLSDDCPFAYEIEPGSSGRCEGNPYWAYFPVIPHASGGGREQFFSYLNLNPGVGLCAGDFPAYGRDLIASTSPLVSGTAQQTAKSSTYPERQMLEGIVDLATGVPLVREVDFELPFGGAVFRHVRTYSEPLISHGELPFGALQTRDDYEQWGSDGAVWDWNGLGWVIGENPGFLMDAQYCIPQNMPKRCYLLSDATHAIPFVWEATGSGEYEGRYVAPPWFDATCTRIFPDSNHADDEIAIFEVWLYGRSIKYIFHVPLNRRFGWCEYDRDAGWIDCDPHDPPTPNSLDSRHGIPYLGLVQKIEDRYGNRMEMTYTEVRQWDAEDGDPVYPCFECAQNSNEFGQLKSLKLFPAGATTAAWTLLYSYRQFGLSDDPLNVCATSRRPHHIHAIYAYAADIPIQSLPADSSIVLPWTVFASAHSIDELDAVEAPFASSFTNWSVRAKYLYSNRFWSGAYTGLHTDGIAQWPGEWLFAPNTDVTTATTETRFPSHCLMKASVTHRANLPNGVNNSEASEECMYRYEDASSVARWGSYRLAGKFSSKTIQALVEKMRNYPAENGVPGSPDSININYLLNAKSNGDKLYTRTAPGTNTVTGADLRDYADYWFDYSAWGYDSYTATSISGFCGLDLPKTVWNSNNSFRFVDRRNGDQRIYNVWNYGILPYPINPGGWQLLGLSGDWTNAGVIHFPFVARNENGEDVRLATQDPAWTTVIDEESPEFPYNPNSVGVGETGIASRRAVGLNSAGFPVNDRTWQFKQGDPTLVEQVGYAESSKYDCSGRLLEKRTKGWSASNIPGNGDPQTDGLIFVYKYADGDCHLVDEKCCYCTPPSGPVPPCTNCPSTNCNPSHEPTVVLIKKGDNSDPSSEILIREVTRAVPDHPELVSTETAYTEKLGGGLVASTTSYEYTFYYRDDPKLGPLATRKIIGPAVPAYPGGPFVQSIQKTSWDDKGREIWSGRGQRFAAGGAPTVFYSVHAQYDDFGHLMLQVVDPDSSQFPHNDPDYTRVPANPIVATPLNLVTTYEYDNALGVTHISYPNGREMRTVYKSDPETNGMLQWVYNNLVPSSTGPQTPYRILGPIGVSLTDKGKLIFKKTVDGAIFDGNPDGEHVNWQGNVLTETQPRYDAAGNVIGVVQAGQDVDPMQASLSYIGLGGVSREGAVDGTVKHYIYDNWGRLTHTYQGTQDTSAFWGVDPPSDPPPPSDNMVLVEKRAYGTGVTNADQLTLVRTYREKPLNQYYDPNEDPSNEDASGWITVVEYDWRMRNVASTRFAVDPNPGDTQGPPAVTTTLTWLDNQDRTRLVAEFAGEVHLSGTLDPRGAGVTTATPTASAILSAATPLSLSETIYNAQGQPEESRTYKVSDASGHSYTATYTYYDEGNRPIEVRSPGSPIQRYVYDAKGRQVLSIQLADTAPNPIEISKTRTVFDKNDRAIRTQHWERRADATGVGPLDANNSVSTYSETWYDDAGKVIASANYGTNTGSSSSSGTYTNGSSPWANGIDSVQGLIPNSTLGVLVTQYGYDDAGRQNSVTQPDGTVTQSQFDGLGRLRLQIENAADADPVNRRLTAYKYDSKGRLSMIGAVLPEHFSGNYDWSTMLWTSANNQVPTIQVTEMIYGDGAVVVNSAGTEVSRHQSWVAEVHYPDRTNGQPDPAHSLTFTYFNDGSVASRTDGLGMRFDYKYDEQSRLILALVTYPVTQLCPPPEEFTPPDRVARVEFSYDAEGKLEWATARSGVASDSPILSQNRYHYDGFDNLEWEQQSVGGSITAATPQINYDWTFASAFQGGGNFNRLDKMTYPKRLNSNVRRQVDLQYGTAGGLDDVLSRIAKIQDLTSGGGYTSYSYGGSSRRASLAIGALIAQSFVGGNGLSGLDAFGRTKDLNYTNSTSTVHRYEYGYDLSGNRTHARVVQMPSLWQIGQTADPGDNTRSYQYAYDALQRLTSADLGSLDSNNTQMQSVTRQVDWSLDNLGNWTGIENGTDPGVTIVQAPPPSAPSGTPPTTTTINHGVSRDNSLESVTRQVGSGSAATNEYVVNIAGNTVFDGAYFYQYDAWNRVVEVRNKGSLTATDFDPAGHYMQCPPQQGQSPSYGIPGDWIARYVYDGLGRLVQKSTPVVVGGNEVRREEYHYDGVRRIQELVRRESTVTVVPGGVEPLEEGGEAESGDPAPGGLGSGEPGEGGGLGLEEPVQLESMEPLAPATVVLALPAGWDQREYVWGPDYVDELAWEIDKDGKPYYALLDANYNVMALVAGASIPPASNDPSGTQTVPAGKVIEQYVWSPYGELLSRDVLDRTTLQLMTDSGTGTAGASLPGIRNKVGHQGLFFERFDGVNTDPALVPTDATAVTTQAPAGRGKGLYYNRWRWYDAQAGRFVSEDMNGAGMAGSESLAYFGNASDVTVESYAAMTQFRDSLSLFAYLASSPLMGTDAAGLEGWWDEDIDEAIDDRAGQAMYALGTLNEGARMISLGINSTLGIAAGFLPGSGLYDAFKSVEILVNGKGGFWEALDIAMAALPMVKGAMTGFRTLSKAAGWGRRACNSFVVGTLIATPFGQMPIEHLHPGDWVTSRYEIDQGDSLVVRRIKETVIGQVEQILWVALADGVSLGVTPSHEVWVEDRGGIPACELAVGDALLRADGTSTQVIEIALEETPTQVFNIEVDGTATYFAEGAWVHNNSCTCAAKAWAKFLNRRGSYKEMKKLTAGHGGDIQAHHILEARHGRNWGLDTDKLPAVVLSRTEHQVITKALNAALPTGKRYSRAKVREAYERVYTQLGKSEWLPSIQRYLR